MPPAAPVTSTAVPASTQTPSRMAAAQRGVEPEQRDGRHVDDGLTGTCDRVGALAQLQYLGTAEAGDLDRAHRAHPAARS